MADFHFRLQALLRYRERLRDLCRQRLAQLLTEDQGWIDRDTQSRAEQSETVAEIQQLQQEHPLPLDQVSSRQTHVQRLKIQQRAIAAERERVAIQIAFCQQALVRADQGVKVLENLAETQREEFLAEEERRSAREREELWQAGQLSRQG